MGTILMVFYWIFDLIMGAVLSVIFFGGLWWTVKKGLTSHNPALWFTTSLFLRMSVVLLGFYFMGRNHFEGWILGLIGFLIARVFIKNWVLKSPDGKVVDHAS